MLRWSSQPYIRVLQSGDLMLATSIPLSGNAFAKVKFLTKMLNIGFLIDTSYGKIQAHYIEPAIRKEWVVRAADYIEQMQGRPVILNGNEQYSH